jgi:RNA polymerase sigma-70 factor (ECF subfamily)
MTDEGAIPTDEQLMLGVKAGSREPFEALFERYRDALWRFFRRRVDGTARAEELLQDVFLALLENASRYEARS